MTTPETRRVDQRRIDFDILAPLVVVALLVAAVAAVMAFTANQSDDASNAPSRTPSGGATRRPAAAAASTPPPAKADFTMKRYDPATAPVAAGPKTFRLTATERRIKVGEKTYDMWTFNDTVPGPVLRAVVGDRITIQVRNAKGSKLSHSADFHASRITLGGGNVQVEPGAAGEYTFTAETPGVFMYHCATAPVLHHIGMGMYGMFIVQPKAGFGPKMPEYAITQSELYASGSDIDDNTADAIAFNGIPGQYVEHPIRVAADSSVRLFVLNAGPSEQSSFHVIGTIFDRALADGNPRNATYGRQALGIPTSGSGVFEMQLRGEGQFPFVTHQFNQAAKGGIGMLLAGDGKPGPGAVADPGANGHH